MVTRIRENNGQARGKGKEGRSKVRWWLRRPSVGSRMQAWSCQSNMGGIVVSIISEWFRAICRAGHYVF